VIAAEANQAVVWLFTRCDHSTHLAHESYLLCHVKAVPYGSLVICQAVLLQPDSTVGFHLSVLLLTQLAWQKHAVVLHLQDAFHIAWVKVSMLHAAM